MGDTPNTDEQRLAEFSNKLDSFKPEGFDETQFAALKEAVIGFHNDEVKGLKINTAKMKEEKDVLSTKLNTLQTTFTENENKMKTLEQQLADNQPEELKKTFENRFRGCFFHVSHTYERVIRGGGCGTVNATQIHVV